MTRTARAFALGTLVLCGGTGAFAQITCPPLVTLAGSSASDVLVGTEQGDRITGNGGQDVLRGLGGSDCLASGSFDDRLFGGPGNDRLAAEGGNDLLDGGEDDDELNGGSGRDTLIGGAGTDQIVGEGDDDVFLVRAGDVPAGKAELLNGGSGLDVVVFDFDPGGLPPRNFTVTDCTTGGRYQVVDVERVEIAICGNGVVDQGEDCDDGHVTNGDGCSASCARECADPSVCGDGDACTTDRCEAGGCVHEPLPGIAGILCAIQRLIDNPPCQDEAIGPKLRLKLKRLVKLLDRTDDVATARAMVRRAARLRTTAAAQAERMANRDKLAPGCAAELAAWLIELESLLDALRGS